MKNLIIKSILLVFLCAGITFGQGYFANAQKALKKKEVQVAFNLAKDAFAKDSIDAAWRILLIVREQKPDKEMYDLLAATYLKKDIVDNAIMYYQEADKLDSLNIERKFTMAEIFVKNQRFTEAVNEYLKVEKLDPTNIKALENISSIFFRAKMYPDAALYYEKFIKRDNRIDNYVKCAQSYDNSKNFEKTLDIVKEGLKLYPNNEVLARLGFYSGIKTRKYEDALNCVVQIADDKLSAGEAKNAGDVANLLKKDELNVKYYKLAALKDPTNKDLFVKLADTAYNDKDFDKAIEFYDKMLATDPKHDHSLQFKAYAYLQKKEYDNARGAFLSWIAVNDTSVTALLNLADCYDKVDSTAKQVEYYNKILKMVEGKEKQYKEQIKGISSFNITRASKAKDWNTVIFNAKRILSYGEDLSALIFCGSAYYNLKQYDDSAIYYKRAQKINPNHELVKDGLRRLSLD